MQQLSSSHFVFSVDNVDPFDGTLKFKSPEEVFKARAKCDKKLEDFSHRKDREQVRLVDINYMNGFMDTVHLAYDKHLPLQLSVSDFIVAIGQGLSHHINEHAEELRSNFVNHEGKEVIEIRRDHYVLGGLNDWSDVFPEFAKEIKKRVKSDIYDVVVDETSVGTANSKIVSELTLMDCMKQYYEYTVSTMCGIPKVCLKGTFDDWMELRSKVYKLKAMNENDCLKLDWWLNCLVPVIEKICEAGTTNKVDVDFWKNIYKISGGSGGPFTQGWINVFNPYIVIKDWKTQKVMMRQNPYMDWKNNNIWGGLKSNQISNGVSEVPFIWDYYGHKIDMIFYGGFMGPKLNDNGFLENEYMWAVAYKKDPNPCNYPKDKNCWRIGYGRKKRRFTPYQKKTVTAKK